MTRLDRYRAVRCRDLPSEMVALAPALAELLRNPPVIINAYPAPMPCSGGTFVDTYLRPSSFAAGLRLASERGTTAIALGQPLLLAQLLVTTFMQMADSPSSIVLIVGGYQCPASLERFLRSRVNTIREVLHVYGAAEVGAAVLAGIRPSVRSRVVYRQADPRCRVVIQDGRLGFTGGSEKSSGPDAGPDDVFWTGDSATVENGGLCISPGASRLDPRVDELLESWSDNEWTRCTGAVAQRLGSWFVQLREDCAPMTSHEVEHFEFARRFGFCWLDKPDWSSTRWT